MKNSFLLCLSVSMLFVFAGCSSSVDSGSSTVAATTNTTSTNPDNSDPKAENTTTPSISNAGIESKTNQNAIYRSKQEFLDSNEGHSFQIAAYKFAKAFFEKNTKVMKSYLFDPDKGFQEYKLDYGFINVEFMILKLNSNDIKKDSVSAQYEFKLDSEDSYTYLQLSMKKVNDQWKIESYGLEK